MHDVRAGVGLAGADAPLGVDAGVHLAAGVELALEHAHLVDDEALDRALHVDHLEATAVEDDRAGVGDLAARLGVERRAVEHQLADLALGEARTVAAPPLSRASGRDSVSSVS